MFTSSRNWLYSCPVAALLLMLLNATASHAVRIAGSVHSSSGGIVAGAEILLLNSGLRTISDSYGRFVLKNEPTSLRQHRSQVHHNRTPELFDVRGRRVPNALLHHGRNAQQVLLQKEGATTKRILGNGRISQAMPNAIRTLPQVSVVSSSELWLDSLVVRAPGFFTKSMQVYNPAGVYSVILDSIPKLNNIIIDWNCTPARCPKNLRFTLTVDGPGMGQIYESGIIEDSLVISVPPGYQRMLRAQFTDSLGYSLNHHEQFFEVSAQQTLRLPITIWLSMISIQLSGFPQSLQAGVSYRVQGSVSGYPTPLAIEFLVVKTDSTPATGFQISHKAIPSEPSIDFSDIELTIRPTEEISNHDYVLRIIVRAGESVLDLKKSFAVYGGSGPQELRTSKITMGSHANANYGACADLDSGRVFLAADVKANSPMIDIAYAYSGLHSVDKFFTPRGLDLGQYVLGHGWPTYAQTQFHKIALSDLQFQAISDPAELKALWDPSLAVNTNLPATQGDTFLVHTSEGRYVLVKITHQEPGPAGNIDLTIKHP